jgi:hypothetical protein
MEVFCFRAQLGQSGQGSRPLLWQFQFYPSERLEEADLKWAVGKWVPKMDPRL